MSFLITIAVQVRMKKKNQFKIYKSIYVDSVQKNRTENYYTLNF